MTQESSADVVQEAFRIGAHGYVVKAHAGSELMAAVEAVRQGRLFVSAGVAGRKFTDAVDAQVRNRLCDEEALPVVHVEVAATVYARAMVELLLLEANDDLLSAIEEAIESKARDSGLPMDLAANQVRIAAALTKIKNEPANWSTWFNNRGYEKEV